MSQLFTAAVAAGLFCLVPATSYADGPAPQETAVTAAADTKSIVKIVEVKHPFPNRARVIVPQVFAELSPVRDPFAVVPVRLTVNSETEIARVNAYRQF